VVRKFALETKKLMHSLCPIDRANKKTRLNLDTLDALMRVSLYEFGVEFMDWNGIGMVFLNRWKPPQESTSRVHGQYKK
jgi:hypothetical protein